MGNKIQVQGLLFSGFFWCTSCMTSSSYYCLIKMEVSEVHRMTGNNHWITISWIGKRSETLWLGQGIKPPIHRCFMFKGRKFLSEQQCKYDLFNFLYHDKHSLRILKISQVIKPSFQFI